MKIWVDAQLPPTLAVLLSETFDLQATALVILNVVPNSDRIRQL
jgi:predicted nuclease of predicted toxin-antitoxin system